MKLFQNARTKKMLIAIIATFFGMLMIPRSEAAAFSVFVLPSIMAGVAFGIASIQMFELTKVWKAANMDKTDA